MANDRIFLACDFCETVSPRLMKYDPAGGNDLGTNDLACIQEFWNAHFDCHPQTGGDLGERMGIRFMNETEWSHSGYSEAEFTPAFNAHRAVEWPHARLKIVE